MSTLYLTDSEIADICAPLISPAAQVRYLIKLGLLVKRKPNGKPLVARKEFERAMTNSAEISNDDTLSIQPNKSAYLKLVGKERRYGT